MSLIDIAELDAVAEPPLPGRLAELRAIWTEVRAAPAVPSSKPVDV
jgi:hypothetical protein